MADLLHFGWIKLHRSVFSHPAWLEHPPAGPAFVWLLGAAAPFSRIDRSFRKPYPVERGQLVTSYAEMTRCIPILTVKQLRAAFTYMEREKMITCEPITKPKCTLVTIVNFPLYQDSESDAALSMEGDCGNFSGNFTGQGFGQGRGQGKGQSPDSHNELPANEKDGQNDGQGQG
ncbi:MAG: hypothetical protein LUC93_03600, partial [Planctomycetaceae bacterium]|nr:hypothetical protein [Planctomycetaceae bacterium]